MGDSKMKKLFLFVAASAFVAIGTVGAHAETWKGTISDSMCGLKHSADKHEGKGADHRACVQKCVKEGGEYVFIANDKAIKIANQKFVGLKAHAGHEVMLTGDMKDEMITVTKIAMPKMEKK
ncbi:MAG: hypothetical protein ABIP65_01715 [Vicinamibacterales bacterium]